MTPQRFSHLLSLVGPSIKRQDTRLREAIPPDERLAITLRYLVTGDSMQTISFSYRVGHSTVSGIIDATCDALWRVLTPEYMRRPTSAEEWRRVSDGFCHICGTSHTVLELLMESMWSCKHHLTRAQPFLITRVHTALF